jgi:hypothetical protein
MLLPTVSTEHVLATAAAAVAHFQDHSSTSTDDAIVDPSQPTVLAPRVDANRPEWRKKKAEILSHLHQCAPLAVASSAHFLNDKLLADEQHANLDIGCYLHFHCNDAIQWNDVKDLSPFVRALWRQ